MRTLNRHAIIGNLGSDPELRYVGQNETAVCTFSVATTDTKKGRDGEYEDVTEWHNVETWGNLAESCAKYLRKGSQIYAAGRSVQDRWEGDDGEMKYKTKLKAFEVHFLARWGDDADDDDEDERPRRKATAKKSAPSKKAPAKKAGPRKPSRSPEHEPDEDDDFDDDGDGYTFEPDDELPF